METTSESSDRIELAERGFDLPFRGTVQYVDRVQVLVKVDDGRSKSLRVGVDRFRGIPRD